MTHIFTDMVEFLGLRGKPPLLAFLQRTLDAVVELRVIFSPSDASSSKYFPSLAISHIAAESSELDTPLLSNRICLSPALSY
jgi:hypothetical protein